MSGIFFTSGRRNKATKNGFTLVELSIVILIIGFLIAGIVAGTGLLKEAEIRSVVRDFQKFQTSYNNFLARFDAVPGDMSNASDYWGTDCSATNNVCDGSGDGKIDYHATTEVNEVSSAWKHLELADMVSGSFDVVTAGGNLILGDQAPEGSVSGTGFYMLKGNYTISSIAHPFDDDDENAVFLGSHPGGSTLTTPLLGGALSPQQAYSIDQKMDDGHYDGSSAIGANTGSVRAPANAYDGSGVVLTTDCHTGGAYNVGNDSALCVIGVTLE